MINDFKEKKIKEAEKKGSSSLLWTRFDPFGAASQPQRTAVHDFRTPVTIRVTETYLSFAPPILFFSLDFFFQIYVW